MNTYIIKAVNPITGKIQEALFLDSYFGNNRSAVMFIKNGLDFLNVDDFEYNYEYNCDVYPFDDVNVVVE